MPRRVFGKQIGFIDKFALLIDKFRYAFRSEVVRGLAKQPGECFRFIVLGESESVDLRLDCERFMPSQ